MPTYEVYDDWTGRPVSVDARSGRKFRRTITVWTSDPTFTWMGEAVDAMSAVAGVYIGTAHPNWPQARCIRIGDAESHPDSPALAVIPIDYEEPAWLPGQVYGVNPASPPAPGQNTGTPPEPESRSPFPEVSFREVPHYYPYDLNGDLFKNTAGGMLEDPPPQIDYNTLMRWTVWKATWSFALGAMINGKINMFAWNGFAAYSLRVTIESAKPITEKGRTVWKIDYLLEHDPHLWHPVKILNAGRRSKHPTEAGKFIVPNEIKGMATRNVVLLDASGYATTTPNDLNFTMRQQIDFAIL